MPKTEGPPPNADDLIAQSYMLCTVCRDCLLEPSKRVYVCRTCSPAIEETGEAIYWCKKCKEATEHEHLREKFKGMPGMGKDADEKKPEGKAGEGENTGTKYLDKLLQEYYDLDAEDVIGGGRVKTRFKYTSVPKEDYGLTAEEILLLDDNQLNKFAHLKQLRPYRNLDEHGNMQKEKTKSQYKINKLRAEVRPELELRRVSNCTLSLTNCFMCRNLCEKIN